MSIDEYEIENLLIFQIIVLFMFLRADDRVTYYIYKTRSELLLIEEFGFKNT